MRILHIVEPAASECGPCEISLVRDLIGDASEARHDVLVVGGTAEAALCRRLELQPSSIVPRPTVSWMAGRRVLRPAVDRLQKENGVYDIIHAWSVRTALASGFTDAKTRVLASLASVSPELNRWPRRRRTPQLIAASPTMARTLAASGLESITVEPGVDPAFLARQERPAIRERLGVDDDVFLVGLLSEPMTWADALPAVDVVHRLTLTDRRVRIVISPDTDRRLQVMRRLRESGAEDLLIIDPGCEEPWQLLAGLDATIIVTRPPPGAVTSPLPILWSMAAGVPVVAERDGQAIDFIEHGVTGLLGDRCDVNGLTGEMVKLVDDPSLARTLATSARRNIESKFNAEAWRERMNAVYLGSRLPPSSFVS